MTFDKSKLVKKSSLVAFNWEEKDLKKARLVADVPGFFLPTRGGGALPRRFQVLGPTHPPTTGDQYFDQSRSKILPTPIQKVFILAAPPTYKGCNNKSSTCKSPNLGDRTQCAKVSHSRRQSAKCEEKKTLKIMSQSLFCLGKNYCRVQLEVKNIQISVKRQIFL